jgi:hypothetical protein
VEIVQHDEIAKHFAETSKTDQPGTKQENILLNYYKRSNEEAARRKKKLTINKK